MPDTWEGWEDSAVHPDVLGDYLRALRDLLDRYEYHGALYGHFGQGCVHTRITFDFTIPEGVEHYRHFLDDAAELIVKFGGSFTGEHGDGESKAAMLPKLFGPELIEAFREFKAIWDPIDRMNPGKVVNPYPPAEVPPPRPATTTRDDPQTVFKYPDDNGSLEYATERCVGVGQCRKDDGDHVPELHGHPRGEALDPGPRPPAQRDAPRRRHRPDLGQRRGHGRARPLPRLQGVQERVPDGRGHGDVQGGVRLSLLQARIRPMPPTRWA